MPGLDVVIVGGGLAGLTCAVELVRAGVSIAVLESSDAPGGRVRTDPVDGFLLDRGFQVLLTAYPETQRQLDYDELKLGRFKPGALVRSGRKFHTLADPLRSPLETFSTVLAPVGSLRDKLKVAELRARVMSGSLEELFRRPETTTIAALEQIGFSSALIEQFFRPFLGGIFLEPWLATSSRKFEFLFRMFAQGEAALPAEGMEAIPRQLASRLPEGTIRTGVRVRQVAPGVVRTSTGDEVRATYVVVATSEPDAAALLRRDPPKTWCSVACMYFDAPEPPFEGPWLVLNGEGGGPINNLTLPSNVSPSYAPAGRTLVSASILGDPLSTDEELEPDVRSQLRNWYGRITNEWRYLRTYRVAYAVPLQSPGVLSAAPQPVDAGPGIYVCGDHTDVSSIQGAMASGRRAAEAILAHGFAQIPSG